MNERAVIAIRKDGVLCRFDGVREAARESLKKSTLTIMRRMCEIC